MTTIKNIDVVCAIIEKDCTFLAAKRSKLQGHGGFWEFPGGKIDKGEDVNGAIVREILEELGAEIIVQKVLNAAVFEYPDKIVRLIPCVCVLKSENTIVDVREHEEVKWVDEFEARKLVWLPPDVEILENYLKQRHSRTK